MLYRLFTYFSLILLFFSVSAYSQVNSMGRFGVQINNYGTKEFNQPIRVTGVSQNKEGVIFISSTLGLLGFDNHQWINAVEDSVTSFRKILIGKDDQIFVSSYNKFGYFANNQDGKLKYFNLSDELVLGDKPIIKIVKNSQNVFFVFDDRTFVYDYKEIKEVKHSSIQSCICLEDCLLLIDKMGKMLKIENDCTLKEIFDLSKVTSNLENIQVTIFNNLEVVITNADMDIFGISLEYLQNSNSLAKESVIKVKNDVIKKYFKDYHLKSVCFYYSIALEYYFIGTNNGLLVLDKDFNIREIINSTKELSNLYVYDIFEDSNNMLWLSLTNGVTSLDFNYCSRLFGGDNDIQAPVISFCQKANKVYCGANNGIFISQVQKDEYLDNHVVFRKLSGELFNDYCYSFTEIDDNLFCCCGDGFYQIVDDKLIRILSLEKVYNARTSVFHKDKLFFVSGVGLVVADYKFVGGKIELSNIVYPKDMSMPCLRIEFSENGGIWIATIFDGLIHLNINNGNYYRPEIIKMDSQNNFFRKEKISFAFYDNNIYAVDNNNIVKNALLPNNPDFKKEDIVFKESELINKTISDSIQIKHILIDKYTGQIIINGNFKSAILEPISLNQYKYKEVYWGRDVIYCNRIYKQDSLIWLASDLGLLRNKFFNREDNLSSQKDFNVIISKIIINDSLEIKSFFNKFETNSNSLRASIDINQNDIEKIKFYFGNTSYSSYNQNRYFCRLKGLDSSFVMLKDINYKEYQKLSPGNYVFEIYCLNSVNNFTNIASVNLNITQTLFQTRAFRVCIWFLVVAIFFICYNYLYSRLKRKTKKLERMAVAKNKTIKEQTLQMQVLKNVVENSQNAVVIVSKNGFMEWANEAFYHLHGYTINELRLKYGDDMFDFIDKHDLVNAPLVSQARKEKRKISYETITYTKPEIKIWIQVVLNPIFDKKGNLDYWVLIQTDITASKKALEDNLLQAQALKNANIQLKQRQEEIEIQKQELLNYNSRLETNLNQINSQNRNIKFSMNYAKTIQSSILPKQEDIDNFFENFIIYMPKDIVSGDFYWFYKIDNTKCIMIVADCTGHGVPGAFMSIIGSNLFNEIIKVKKIYDPKQITTELQHGLLQVLSNTLIQISDGIETQVVYFDFSLGEITFCLSNCSLMILDSFSKKINRYRGGKNSKEVEGQIIKEYVNHKQKLNANDVVFLMTDGIIDQNNPDRRRLGTQKLIEYLERPQNSVAQIGECLKRNLLSFMNGEPQRDDITVVGLKIKK